MFTFARYRPQPRRAHKARDPMAAHRPTARHQVPMETGTAVPPLMPVEAARDGGHEAPVLLRVGALPPPAPRVEPGGSDAVAATERRDVVAGMLGRERVDEGEALAFRAAENRMAFFKRSCSSCSAAYFRSRAWKAASSRAGPRGGAFGGCPRRTPSRASLRHFDNMKGWISSAAATVYTCMPGCWLNRTAVSLNSSLYRRTFRGPARGMVTLQHRYVEVSTKVVQVPLSVAAFVSL